MIADIRLQSQQLINPVFDSPKELVAYMGAIQAQEYTMARWAVGVRLKSGSLTAVNEALQKGEILRTHVMRPTWHFIAAEDIRWMLKLSGKRIIAANDSYAKGHCQDISAETYHKAFRLLEKLLEGNNHQTKLELEEAFRKDGFETDDRQINRFFTRAEAEGLICSGADKGSKPTFALLEERVPPVKELHKEEALAKLAHNYFRSHSPATLADFIWWSGLTTTEAKLAMNLISDELTNDLYADRQLFVHNSCKEPEHSDILHLLPSFDEYLISYKDRTDVLDLQHHPKAFNTFGTFHPVVLYQGKIVGNWKKTPLKNELKIETSWFEKSPKIKKTLLSEGEKRLKTFYSSPIKK